MKTLVLGASLKPERFSNRAIHRLREKNIPVLAVGRRQGRVGDVDIITEKELFQNIHTITIYLNESNQKEFEKYILDLKPKRIIFNPGAENPELMKKASALGIEAIEACTLVMLRTGEF